MRSNSSPSVSFRLKTVSGSFPQLVFQYYFKCRLEYLQFDPLSKVGERNLNPVGISHPRSRPCQTWSRKELLDPGGRLWHSCNWNVSHFVFLPSAMYQFLKVSTVWDKRANVYYYYLLHPEGNGVSGSVGTRIYVPDRGPRPKTRTKFMMFIFFDWCERLHFPDRRPRTRSTHFLSFKVLNIEI